MIGEAFENSDDICGAVVNVRAKGDKIGIICIFQNSIFFFFRKFDLFFAY